MKLVKKISTFAFYLIACIIASMLIEYNEIGVSYILYFGFIVGYFRKYGEEIK